MQDPRRLCRCMVLQVDTLINKIVLQAQGWSLASQFGGASAAGPRAPSQQAATVPVMPTLPTKFNEPQQQPASEVAGRPSQVPTPGMSNFNAEQK
jgi:hypothetical protein